MKLLTYQDISELTGLSVEALRKREHRGQLPEPDLTPSGRGPGRAVYWYEDTIRQWIKETPDDK